MASLSTLPGLTDKVVEETKSGVVMTLPYYQFLKSIIGVAATTQLVRSSAAPTASDIPEGEARDWHNTTTSTTVRAINIGGVVKTITYT